MVYNMPKDENVWGRSTTTFDEIVALKRTATTRRWTRGIPFVGEKIIFFNKKGEEVLVEVIDTELITTEKFNSEEFRVRWSIKEGWKKSRLRPDMIGATQVTFKVI